MTSTRIVLGTTVLAVALGAGLAVAPAASASGGNAIRNGGSCSTHGTWKLKAKADDGAVEVEAEVDTNIRGQQFSWTIRDNGTLVRSGTATTGGPSGSFSVQRTIANRAGGDHIVFRATRNANVCSGAVDV